MKQKLILLFIVIIAVVLRFYQLGSTPVSLDWDEAALAYNAYSISETGRDEYGEFLPVVLRSFNDYKPALYSYLAIPSISVFGLNNFAVRFPSAIFGVLTVLATYFLVRELFPYRQTTQNHTRLRQGFGGQARNYAELVALVTALLLAISPWHIQFSRTAFEANIGLSLNIFTALFFIKSFKNPVFLSFAAVFSALSIYSYQSEKVFAPFFVLLMVFIFRKEFFAIPKKYIASAIVLGLIIISPMVFYLTTNPEALSRARGSILTSTQTTFLENNVERIRIDRERGDMIGLVFDNRRVEYAKSAIGGYLSHFDFNWLFIIGDSARHHAPGMGLLYLFELPFLLLGIYALIFGRIISDENKKGKHFLFAWLLLAPIPAAFTTDVPHAVRTLNFLPTFQIFIAVGLIFAYEHISKIKYQIAKIRISHLILILYILLIIFNILYYLNQYFVQMDYFYSKYWQHGRKEEIAFVKSVEENYDKVVVSNKDFLDQSYIFYLYYLQYPPRQYQNEYKIYSDGERTIRTFDKYEFREIDWGNEKLDESRLYVGAPREFNEDVDALKTINYLNGEEAVRIVGGKK